MWRIKHAAQTSVQIHKQFDKTKYGNMVDNEENYWNERIADNWITTALFMELYTAHTKPNECNMMI